MNNSDNSILNEFLSGLCIPYSKTIQVKLSEKEIIEILKNHFYSKEKFFSNEKFSGYFTESKKFTVFAKTAFFKGYTAYAYGVINSAEKEGTSISIKSNGNWAFLLLPISVAGFGVFRIIETLILHKNNVELIAGGFLIVFSLIISGMFKGMNTSIVEDFSDFIREKSKK